MDNCSRTCFILHNYDARTVLLWAMSQGIFVHPLDWRVALSSAPLLHNPANNTYSMFGSPPSNKECIATG